MFYSLNTYRIDTLSRIIFYTHIIVRGGGLFVIFFSPCGGFSAAFFFLWWPGGAFFSMWGPFLLLFSPCEGLYVLFFSMSGAFFCPYGGASFGLAPHPQPPKFLRAPMHILRYLWKLIKVVIKLIVRII